jgi:branched-chain amino acid transport system ATP-binding protein
MLRVTNLTASYGSVPVLNDISFSLAQGEVLAVLGRNGVGKTTLLRTLMGLLRTGRGLIELDGSDIGRIPTHQIVRRGMTLVPQGRGILGKLTVLDNLVIGMNAAGPRSPMTPDEALRPFPMLAGRLNELASTLSGGQQQQLALARALAGRPSVVLLDEPSEGVQPNIVAQIGELIRTISETSGTSVVLVEQNIELALHAASRCLVMEKGRIVHEGPAEEFRNDAVLKRYLAI